MVINYYYCRKACKVGIRYLEDGTKVRVSRGIGASGSIIPRPEILKIRTTPRPTVRKYLKLILTCNSFTCTYLKAYILLSELFYIIVSPGLMI